MGARDPAEAVEVLDLLLKFFGDGERWVKGRWSDRRGNRCHGLTGQQIISSAGQGASRDLSRGTSQAVPQAGHTSGFRIARYHQRLRTRWLV